MAEHWEYPQEGDFFSFVINTASSREQIYRSIIVWNACGRGETLSDPETHRRLEEQVELKLRELRDR
jgi:hypothetical protein